MKKFALIAASLIAFAGCARNETDDLGANETTRSTDTTAAGTAATSQSGRGAMVDTNSPSLFDTNRVNPLNATTNSLDSAPGANLDTNNVSQPIPQAEQPNPSTPPPLPQSSPNSAPGPVPQQSNP